MLKKAGTTEVKIEKLNLIPIMDAVFIFIFFLLFSAQFIKIYEIESDAPMVSEAPPKEKKDDKKPLNLKVKISSSEIILTKGFNDIILKSFGILDEGEEYTELKEFVLNIRKENPDDNYIIIAPEPNVKYDGIVTIIDAVKNLPESMKTLELTVKGQPKKFRTIFEQIVLEPID